MTNLELSLIDYKIEKITINTLEDLNSLRNIHEEIDMIDCTVLCYDVNLQNIIDILSRYSNKHFKIKILINVYENIHINELSVDGFLIKNIQIEGRYLIFNLYSTELLNVQK
ncbi:MAG TPA: hypothetical protein IAC02_03945, partial [Candidatus Coprovivens excrementavium]|nr:hypothetical protein [Candidatus Coprovivens excrementavium]